MLGPIDRGYEASKTLCWNCGNACGGCSWSDDLEPVEGWHARETYMKSSDMYTYTVIDCPEYCKDKKKNSSRMNADGCISLLQKALELAWEDYIKTTKLEKRDEVVCFLADWIPDYEDALRQLHADRNRYWGMRLLDEIKRQIKRQPLLLYAGGDD